MSEQSPLSLGTEDIKKLLMRYAVPAIVAMTAASLYNMMDSIFIGHGVGALGIAGLAVTFPFINLAAAFGSLVGVGASTLVSVKMGQKDLKSAEAVLGNVLLLNTVIGFLFMTVCLIFLDPILYFFGASADTLPYARDYMKVILYGNLITHIYMGLNEVMRASGYPQRAMMATLFAVLINGVLPWGRSVPSFWLCSGCCTIFPVRKVLFVFKKEFSRSDGILSEECWLSGCRLS